MHVTRWVQPTLEQFLASTAVERDPAFRAAVCRQTGRGMIVVGVLGLAAAGLYLVAHLGAGKAFVWTFGGRPPDAVVTLWDKALLVGASAALLPLSQTRWGTRHGRLFIAGAVFAVGLSFVVNDLARADLSFTPAWLTILLLVPLTALPYSLGQGAALAAALLALYGAALGLSPEAGVEGVVPVARGVYTVLVALVASGVSGFLYTSRHKAFQAHHRAEVLKQRLADRSLELERSLQELQAAQEHLVRQEKLASLGQLTAGIAHEIQNPLNFVNNFAALNEELAQELAGLLAPAGPPEVDAVLQDLDLNARRIREHGARASRIVRRMLEHAAQGRAPRCTVDLNRLLAECIDEVRTAGSGDVTLTLQADPSVGDLEGSPSDLKKVFVGLLDNAVWAACRRGGGEPAAGGARVEVQTERRGESVGVCVRDNGAGIPPEACPRLFEPFFTTRPSGDGVGLGLSIAYDIVTQGHGGTIDVWTEEGVGCAFTVCLPVARGTEGAVA